MMRVRFTVNGRMKDWNAVGQLITTIVRKVDEAEKLARQQAEAFINEVRRSIWAQDPYPASWPPLSPAWVKEKGHDLAWIEGAHFVQEGLVVRKIRAPSGGVRYFGGADPYKVHPSGLTYEHLGKILEYGYRPVRSAAEPPFPRPGITQRIPARPVFGPVRYRLRPIFLKQWRDWWREMKLKA